VTDFNETCILAKHFCKNNQIQNFVKAHSVGTVLLQGGKTDIRKEGQQDRRKDMKKLTVALHNLWKESKIGVLALAFQFTVLYFKGFSKYLFFTISVFHIE
jgi:hypothetical protein